MVAYLQFTPLDPRLADFPNDAGGLCDASIFPIAGPSPRKGTLPGIPDPLSQDTDRWPVYLLQRGGPERRADTFAATRTPLFVAHVRAALRPAFRSLSPCRTRLPGLWTQRLAGPERIRIHVRSHRRNHESLHRSARAFALHSLHA